MPSFQLCKYLSMGFDFYGTYFFLLSLIWLNGLSFLTGSFSCCFSLRNLRNLNVFSYVMTPSIFSFAPFFYHKIMRFQLYLRSSKRNTQVIYQTFAHHKFKGQWFNSWISLQCSFGRCQACKALCIFYQVFSSIQSTWTTSFSWFS